MRHEAVQCISCGQVFRTARKYDQHDCPKRKKKPFIPSLSIVNSDIQAADPSCHCCGAIMVRDYTSSMSRTPWRCMACGAATGHS